MSPRILMMTSLNTSQRRRWSFITSSFICLLLFPLTNAYTRKYGWKNQQNNYQQNNYQQNYDNEYSKREYYKMVYYEAMNQYREQYFEQMNVSALRFIYERGAGCQTNNMYGLKFETFDLFCEKIQDDEDEEYYEAENGYESATSFWSKLNWFNGWRGYNPYGNEEYYNEYDESQNCDDDGGCGDEDDDYNDYLDARQQQQNNRYTKVCRMDQEFIIRGRFNTTFQWPDMRDETYANYGQYKKYKYGENYAMGYYYQQRQQKKYNQQRYGNGQYKNYDRHFFPNFTLSASVCKYSGRDCMDMGNKTEIDLCSYVRNDDYVGDERNQYEYKYEGYNWMNAYKRNQNGNYYGNQNQQYQQNDARDSYENPEAWECPQSGAYQFEERVMFPFHLGEFRPNEEYYQALFEANKEKFNNKYSQYAGWDGYEEQAGENDGDPEEGEAEEAYENPDGLEWWEFPETYEDYFKYSALFAMNKTRVIDEFLNHTSKFMLRIHFYPLAKMNYEFDSIHCHIPLRIVGENFNEEVYFKKSSYRVWEFYRTGVNRVATYVSVVSLLALTVYGVTKRKIVCGPPEPCCGCDGEEEYEDEFYDDDSIRETQVGGETIVSDYPDCVSLDDSDVILPPNMLRREVSLPYRAPYITPQEDELYQI